MAIGPGEYCPRLLHGQDHGEMTGLPGANDVTEPGLLNPPAFPTKKQDR